MLKVLKRNSTLVNFESSKIENAVIKAFEGEGSEEYRKEVAHKIAVGVTSAFIDNDIVNIDDIQDSVEEHLMKENPQIAKKYIIYRNNKEEERRKGQYRKSTIPPEVISRLKHEESKMTPLGELVYSRTYSRYLPAFSRRETWLETCIRAVEYNTSLAKTSTEEKVALLENMFYLKQFLSGRTLWIGGTEIAREYPLSNFNCAFETIEKYDDFKEMFYLLMLGAGVGIRVKHEDVVKLPELRKVELHHIPYESKPKSQRVEYTSIVFDNKNKVTIYVGDSKEGWAEAIHVYFDILSNRQYKKVESIVIDYNNIRDRGERLVRMGGTASGPQVLQTMFMNISKMIHSKQGSLVKLAPIDALDIANHIGECVVSGGVRRTAEMVMIDAHDTECIEAKSEIYKEVNGEWIANKELLHRQLSNNTIKSILIFTIVLSTSSTNLFSAIPPYGITSTKTPLPFLHLFFSKKLTSSI